MVIIPRLSVVSVVILARYQSSPALRAPGCEHGEIIVDMALRQVAINSAELCRIIGQQDILSSLDEEVHTPCRILTGLWVIAGDGEVEVVLETVVSDFSARGYTAVAHATDAPQSCPTK